MIDHVRVMRGEGMKYAQIRSECIKLGYVSRTGKTPSQQTLSRWCEGVVVLKVERDTKGRKARRRLDEMKPSLYYYISKLRDEGLSYRKIAKQLEDEEIWNSKGNKITHTQVVRILKSR